MKKKESECIFRYCYSCGRGSVFDGYGEYSKCECMQGEWIQFPIPKGILMLWREEIQK